MDAPNEEFIPGLFKEGPGWSVLNQWGYQYYKEVQKGHPGVCYLIKVEEKDDDGNSVLVKKLIDERSENQKELGRKIVHGVTPYFTKISHALLFKEGCQITGNGISNIIKLGNKSGITQRELIDEASSTILCKLGEYDPNKGAISTWINYWATSSMRRAGKEMLRYVKFGEELQRKVENIMRGSPVEDWDDKIAKINYNRKPIGYISGGYITHSMSSTYLSINTPIQSKSDSYGGPNKLATLEDYLIDEKEKDPCDKIAIDELMEIAFSNLTEKEKEVMILRFGIGRNDGLTLSEIGAEFGITPEAIRQIEGKALKKMRKRFQRFGIDKSMINL